MNTLLIVSTLAAAFSAGAPPADLTLKTLAAYRALIEPDQSECAYLRVDWEVTLQDGIRRAVDEQKPVMLYAMNGHPLGCT